MRTEDSNNMHKKFHKRTYNGVLQSATVLKKTGYFLVIKKLYDPFL